MNNISTVLRIFTNHNLKQSKTPNPSKYDLFQEFSRVSRANEYRLGHAR